MENREALERAKVVEMSKRDGIPLESQKSRRSSQGGRVGSVGMV